MIRRTRVVLAVGALVMLASSCSSSDAATTSSVVVASPTSVSVEQVIGPTVSVPGPSDDELIAAAVAALAAAGEPVGEDREPLVKRSDTTAEVSFPTRRDLPPVIGGEPHVHLDPLTGEVLHISHTR